MFSVIFAFLLWANFIRKNKNSDNAGIINVCRFPKKMLVNDQVGQSSSSEQTDDDVEIHHHRNKQDIDVIKVDDEQ